MVVLASVHLAFGIWHLCIWHLCICAFGIRACGIWHLAEFRTPQVALNVRRHSPAAILRPNCQLRNKYHCRRPNRSRWPVECLPSASPSLATREPTQVHKIKTPNVKCTNARNARNGQLNKCTNARMHKVQNKPLQPVESTLK